jgi:hypothetical protein
MAGFACSSWHLTSVAGRQCVVRKGQTVADVFEACGVPDRSATQPKALSPGKSLLEPVVCSAPAYLYGRDAVLFDCNGAVAGVEAADGSGLVLDQPRTYDDPDPAATRRQKDRTPLDAKAKKRASPDAAEGTQTRDAP